MSIIADALKKAQERKKTITSRENLNKVLDPERKATYKREEFKVEKPQLQPKVSPSKAKNMEFLKTRYVKSKVLIISGILLLVAIIFLTIANIFLIPSPGVKVLRSGRTSDVTDVPLEAEAYTDVKSEIALIEDKAGLMDKMASVFKTGSVQEEFLSNFTLNGIVYDTEDSWAIINNKVVRVGERLAGAKVISIAPQKVVLLFKNEKFDLSVE